MSKKTKQEKEKKPKDKAAEAKKILKEHEDKVLADCSEEITHVLEKYGVTMRAVADIALSIRRDEQ